MSVYPVTLPAVYVLTHRPTGRFYIGSTKNLYYRLGKHKYALNKGLHSNHNLQSIFTAWDDLDISFTYCSSKQLAEAEEQKLLDIRFSESLCCNISQLAKVNWESTGAHAVTRGKSLSEEVKEKISKGRTGKVHSSETKHKISMKSKEINRLYCCKEIECDGVRFSSVADAAKHFGLSATTISRRVRGVFAGYPGWGFVTASDKPGAPL